MCQKFRFGENMRNMIVFVRVDNFQKVSVVLVDFVCYGGMKIRGDFRIILLVFLEWVFEKVSGEKLRRKFKVYVIVQIDFFLRKVIGRLMDIYFLVYVFVVFFDSEVWMELMRFWGIFEKFRGFYFLKRMKVEEIERKRKKWEYEDLDLQEF